ncbi:hypothetical protein J2R99_000198 [Rhodopseudomonas julia]|uniref:Uncharacterized protein n=1 Tax=Rhodopseudomonas julia TaxID=200617 RepID=A0ABU0C1G3_9BRAD|nr:hypothetical protein [Rhodopseudomonas julia]MDQ0324349.1 hypothetical protein [Rhodopseudomonas julia]
MWSWVQQYSGALSALTSLLMLLVWFVYLQLLLVAYRRRWRSTVLINRGGSLGTEARCLISNMSAEAIYLTSLIAFVTTDDGTYRQELTDLRDLSDSLDADPRSRMKQGPLKPGEYLDIGTFHDLILTVGDNEGQGSNEAWIASVRSLELTAVIVYGADDLLAGARRTFEIRHTDDDIQICPTTSDSQQIRSRRERRKIEKQLQSSL